MGYCASVIRVSIQVSLLKPSRNHEKDVRASPRLRGPFSSYNKVKESVHDIVPVTLTILQFVSKQISSDITNLVCM